MNINSRIILGLAVFVLSCKKNDSPNPNGEQVSKDVSYGTHAQHKMDIYLPAGRSTTTTKVIIMIHGGGWNTGSKADLDIYIDSLRRREPSYAVFNLNYRLANPPDLFPVQENDIKAAVEFIYSKRNEYHISDKFVLVGVSAGAHLALLQGYKYTSPVKVKAIIDFFGPTELVDLYNNPPNPLVQPLLVSVTGGNPTTHASIYASSSPINAVTVQSSPTMILQGGADNVVSPSQSDNLNIRLFTAGVIHQYVFYPTESHGWTGPNLTDSFNKIQAFLSANVN
ncbi:MAG: alpha/beta hydrolase [Bacteroidetes bacterium]|nr:MAG: alpha/beta hydrolase [Bacteroidota bacterium]